MKPTVLEIIAKNKTPNALISLMTLISGMDSLLFKSHRSSIAVLKISALITMPIQSEIPTHSKLFSLKIKPKENTNKEMNK